MALDRRACQTAENVEAVHRADLVYFSGGKPGYLLRTLRSTPLWEAVLAVLARGGVVVGCSAGAMILGGWIPGWLNLRHPPFWEAGLGLVPQAVVLPHFNEFPPWVGGVLSTLKPRHSYVLGVDGGTALVGGPQGWQVLGSGRVVVRDRSGVRSYMAGDKVQVIG
jgi:cyanophycinase-like exopeptidase